MGSGDFLLSFPWLPINIQSAGATRFPSPTWCLQYKPACVKCVACRLSFQRSCCPNHEQSFSRQTRLYGKARHLHMFAKFKKQFPPPGTELPPRHYSSHLPFPPAAPSTLTLPHPEGVRMLPHLQTLRSNFVKVIKIDDKGALCASENRPDRACFSIVAVRR